MKFPTRILQRSGGYPLPRPDGHRRQAECSRVVLRCRRPSDGASRPSRNRSRRRKSRTVSGSCRRRERTSSWSFATTFTGRRCPGKRGADRSPVIDAIKKTIPNKPIRHAVNTHSAFRSIPAGSGTYAAEGATVITHRDNVPYYEQAWANPRTISPDRLAKAGRKPVSRVAWSATALEIRRLARALHLSTTLEHAQRRHAG